MARNTVPGPDGFLFYADIVTTNTKKYDYETRTWVDVEPWESTSRYGPYRDAGTARGVATQMSRYGVRSGTQKGSVSRVKVGAFEPVVPAHEELRALRAEVEELRFRLAGLDK